MRRAVHDRMARRAIAAFILAMVGAGSAHASDPLRVVAFGTSLTARGGWQEPLGQQLGACLKRAVTVETVALSGSTSAWALTQTGKVAALKPDVVLIEFYANDAALNRLISLGASRDNIGRILDALRSGAPTARIIEMTMNPIIGLGGWVRPRLSAFAAAHREEAERRGLETIDFTARWTALPAGELAAAIPDGRHPLPDVAARIMVPDLVSRLGGCGDAASKAGSP